MYENTYEKLTEMLLRHLIGNNLLRILYEQSALLGRPNVSIRCKDQLRTNEKF